MRGAGSGRIINANSDFTAITRQPDDPYRELAEKFLTSYNGLFEAPRSARHAAAVVVEGAPTAAPRCRWQTSDQAATLVGLSLADLDGAKTVNGMDHFPGLIRSPAVRERPGPGTAK